MARATSAHSESESERVRTKKQKKGEESDDPMDEDGDGEDKEEAEEEYEIEKIIDSSTTIFADGETAYHVKWKGYPDSENSWVRESDAPHADELISRFLDEQTKKKAAEKKKSAAKSRKSTDRTQEPKKRGRLSTRHKADSDSDEPERSPVQPTTKKQKKASVSSKKKESDHEEESDVGEFTKLDKYMHLDSWDSLIAKIETIERGDKDKLYIYGLLTTGETFRLASSVANVKFPQKVIKFYEDNLRWKALDEGA